MMKIQNITTDICASKMLATSMIFLWLISGSVQAAPISVTPDSVTFGSTFGNATITFVGGDSSTNSFGFSVSGGDFSGNPGEDLLFGFSFDDGIIVTSGGSLDIPFDLVVTDNTIALATFGLGGFTGGFGITLSTTPTTGTFEYIDQAGIQSIPLVYSVSSVPIPATVWLFGSGLLGLIGVAQRKVQA